VSRSRPRDVRISRRPWDGVKERLHRRGLSRTLGRVRLAGWVVERAWERRARHASRCREARRGTSELAALARLVTIRPLSVYSEYTVHRVEPLLPPILGNYRSIMGTIIRRAAPGETARFPPQCPRAPTHRRQTRIFPFPTSYAIRSASSARSAAGFHTINCFARSYSWNWVSSSCENRPPVPRPRAPIRRRARANEPMTPSPGSLSMTYGVGVGILTVPT
jgi:hypothetical protein